MFLVVVVNFRLKSMAVRSGRRQVKTFFFQKVQRDVVRTVVESKSHKRISMMKKKAGWVWKSV